VGKKSLALQVSRKGDEKESLRHERARVIDAKRTRNGRGRGQKKTAREKKGRWSAGGRSRGVGKPGKGVRIGGLKG